uniref:Pentatricopeptide repeat-containing protein n=1 Tax=Ananas comosus var. bracteatus TaxID=296719 RepID=A0A6V7Q6Z2_ANACO|nr:unnamed protein product [Ananas comosus var. bracteatus]
MSAPLPPIRRPTTSLSRLLESIPPLPTPTPTPTTTTSPISDPPSPNPNPNPNPKLPPDLLPLFSSLLTHPSLTHLSAAFSALSLLRHHRLASPLLLLHPISSLLHCASAINALPEGLQLHALALSSVSTPPLPRPRLTSFYAAHGLLSSAHAVAASASATGYVLPWNLLISSYLRHGLSSHALAAFNEMLRRGVSPDRFTYPSALRACAELSDLESGREIHRRIEVEGDAHLGVNVFAHNALIAMYAKCGNLGAARKVFDEMPQRDIVSWNTIISAYAANATWHEAFALFDRMRTLGLELNSVTWNTIASGYIHTGDFARALRLISQMMFSWSDSDFVTFVIGLNACSRAGSLRPGRELHGAAIRARCDGLETVRNALITMYSRCGDPDQAHVLFSLFRTAWFGHLERHDRGVCGCGPGGGRRLCVCRAGPVGPAPELHHRRYLPRAVRPCGKPAARARAALLHSEGGRV